MSELLSLGLELMLTGMGVVLVFLTLLVVLINIMAFIARDATTTSDDDSGNMVAAISIAISQYRNKHK